MPLYDFKNLETGNILTDKIENTTGGSVWSNDNKTLFYTKKDPLTLRSSSIYRHILGTDASEDVIVFEEKDETYSTYVYKTKSHKFIVIGSSSTLSSEFRIISADNPYGDWKIIQPREDNLEYSLAHYGDYFYIQTNKDDAINFKLMKTPVNKTTKENWVDVIPHRKETLLEDVSIFKNYLVIEERTQGLGKIRIKTWDGKEDYYLPFDEETYSAGVYANPEFDTDVIRYSYNSMTTPNSVIDFNMKNQTKEVKKEPIAEVVEVKETEVLRIKDRLREFKDRINKGENFATMAVLYSEDPGSATKGGELGFFGRGDMVSEFSAVAFNLDVGEVSKIVKTDYGYHIIQLIY